ncbi:hypothetical protein SELMODRAFT_270517 [Selaginella moellendorffii]|uniref:protein-serine/threonine phosphatase n=1 Tax=Selaginella moellendorffii TaxID=88036 RepID=D8R3C6_SELML|nr:probable protein phosphatase 2C 58 [Selaginella moellendorffii]EFJ32923.1 hypothetical protein SELMODRAFT_270517 [Selaginella moellendorffii]|eukprot:XP_002965503.1 probable protein phosphatase 2C 58 [Selaginella moellendorffii]
MCLRRLIRTKTSEEREVTYGSACLKGRSSHPMEDFFVADYKEIKQGDNTHDLGLFAIYDGHLGHNVPAYLQKNLFDNILNEPGFWSDPSSAIRNAYERTDKTILEKSTDLGIGGSTAVTAILIDGSRLLVANIGDSRAVLSRGGEALQLSVDHEPGQPAERDTIQNKGGFVVKLPGDVPRVDGQLAVARAFGDKNLKDHLSADPDIKEVAIEPKDEFLILASDGLWKVMKNQEAVDHIRKVKDPKHAAEKLTSQAVLLNSSDDISCVVVHLRKK